MQFHFRRLSLAGLAGSGVGTLGGAGTASVPSGVIGIGIVLVPARVLAMLGVVLLVVWIGGTCEEPLILPHLGRTLPWWKVHLFYVGCLAAAYTP